MTAFPYSLIAILLLLSSPSFANNIDTSVEKYLSDGTIKHHIVAPSIWLFEHMFNNQVDGKEDYIANLSDSQAYGCDANEKYIPAKIKVKAIVPLEAELNPYKDQQDNWRLRNTVFRKYFFDIVFDVRRGRCDWTMSRSQSTVVVEVRGRDNLTLRKIITKDPNDRLLCNPDVMTSNANYDIFCNAEGERVITYKK